MSEETINQDRDYIALTSDIVAAYVSNNHVAPSDLAALIEGVYGAITGISSPTASSEEDTAEKPSPAQVRKSVTPDHLVSFLDGKTYKTLKRHLTGHGLDPHSYRQRFGLPSDYPMVAPNYAAQRSALAKQIGLGRPGGRADEVAEDGPTDAAESTEPKARGRRKAA